MEIQVQPQPKLEAGRRGEEQREEEDVRWADVGRVLLARESERDRDAIEEARLLRDDVLGRSAPDREHVDPGDDQRDQHDPRERLEHAHEPEADRRQCEKLRDVEQRAEPGEVEQEPRARRARRDVGDPAGRCGRKRKPWHRERHGHHDEAAITRTSGQCPRSGSTPAPASQATSSATTATSAAARRALSTEAAAPTTGQAP